MKRNRHFPIRKRKTSEPTDAEIRAASERLRRRMSGKLDHIPVGPRDVKDAEMMASYVEQKVIAKIERGAVPADGSFRIVTGVHRGRVTKRIQFIDTETGQPTRRLDELFDGGLVQ